MTEERRDPVSPATGKPMEKVHDPDVTYYVDHETGDLFLDAGVLNALTTGLAADIEFMSVDMEAHADTYEQRICPRCPGTTMRKVDVLHHSGIIIDFCPECRGFYLDTGELEKTDAFLRDLSRKPFGDEYREFHDGRLVRIDRVGRDWDINRAVTLDIGMDPGDGVDPSGAHPNMPEPPNTYLRIEVYYRTPLGFDLRISPFRWTQGLARILGWYDDRDIKTGDDDFDDAFLVQGDADRVRGLLNDDVRATMLRLLENLPEVLGETGRLEVVDNRIVYTVGPFEDDTEVDFDAEGGKATDVFAVLADDIEQAAALDG